MGKATYIQLISDEASMLEWGKQLAQASLHDATMYDKVQKDTSRTIFLYGQLGAGKTTVARGFLQGLGYKGRVKSPTYTLVESYEFSTGTVFHFDLYRLHTPEELESIGIQDYFIPRATCLVEWPEHGKGLLPLPDLSCYISLHDNSREIKLTAHTAYGKTILQRLQHDK